LTFFDIKSIVKTEEKTMTKQDIIKFLERKIIIGEVYEEENIKGDVYLRVKTERFEISKNLRGSIYELKTTWSGQSVDTAFISEMKVMVALLAKLNGGVK
jgi:hypothetical protein